MSQEAEAVPSRPEIVPASEAGDLEPAIEPMELWPPLLPPEIVRMLVVTDGLGAFQDEKFGLGPFLESFQVRHGGYVKFRVQTAHRGPYPYADSRRFRFDATDLSQFDVIWLFGVSRPPGTGSSENTMPPLSERELRVLTQFMNGGGGVFATGDHEDLGAPMCGRVPRVRSMRKWQWDPNTPPGLPVAPRQDGPGRISTLRKGHDVQFTRDDQSDDRPQTIFPTMYPTWSFAENALAPTRYPHPILSGGPRGLIRYMPDHMHEGECYAPTDLDESVTFDGYTTEEYPMLQNSRRLRPEIIGQSWVIPRTDDDQDGPVNGRVFPCLAAWDGHRVQRGRVLTASTFHHYVRVNLIGDPEAIGDKKFGFMTPEGRTVLDEIRTFYRNVAVWLARRERATGMWRNALWASRWNPTVGMAIRRYDSGIKAVDVEELLRIGNIARDVLAKSGSPSMTCVWISETVNRLLPRHWDAVQPVLDPWVPVENDKAPEPLPWLYAQTLGDVALGGAMYALAEQFPEPGPELADKAAASDWDALLRPGADVAERRMSETMDRWGGGLSKLAKQIG